MTSESVLTIVGSAAFSSVVIALIGVVQQRSTLKANAPKAVADSSAVNLEAQGKTVDRLSAENARLAARLDRANAGLDQANEGLAQANERIDAIVHELREERARNAWFRTRVEGLLTEKGIPTPEWWSPMEPPSTD